MFKLSGIVKEYRPELNGLRGLAVVLVLLFHLDFYWMEGGFLGVDIFLVISGYFISKNILYDRQNGKFTFKRFYTKRLRRLFPALIFTLIVVLLVGYFLFTPAYFERLGKSSMFSALSLSNFFFWQESGYFDLDAINKPLLHMWSLSLEEQFYLFWPLLLVTMHGILRKYLLWFVIGFIAISIGLAEWYFDTDASATFFLIPFRMFEFLLGAACIWLEKGRLFRYNVIKEFLFTAGFGVMIFSAIRLSSFTRMPGYISLIPCGGAMLAIIGGKARFSSWLLKNKLVELIGKASYSIYLIHWPLIVYFKFYTLDVLSASEQVILAIVSVLLGIGMYYFIENTFRYPKKKYQRLDPVWFAVPAFLGMICIAGTTVSSSKGMTGRFSGGLFMSQEEILKNRDAYFKEYWQDEDFLKGDSTKGHIITFGNSHSVDLIYALRQNGFEGRITALKSTGKCFNFGFSAKPGFDDHCRTRLEENLRRKEWGQVDAIYLHDNWPQLKIEEFRESVDKARELSDAPIFVFGPKMVYTKPVPDIVAASRNINPDRINEFAWKYRIRMRAKITELLIKELSKPDYEARNIRYIDVLKISQREGDIKYHVVDPVDTTFLYFDAGHFTKRGSKIFGASLKEAHPYLFDIQVLKSKFSDSLQ